MPRKSRDMGMLRQMTMFSLLIHFDHSNSCMQPFLMFQIFLCEEVCVGGISLLCSIAEVAYVMCINVMPYFASLISPWSAEGCITICTQSIGSLICLSLHLYITSSQYISPPQIDTFPPPNQLKSIESFICLYLPPLLPVVYCGHLSQKFWYLYILKPLIFDIFTYWYLNILISLYFNIFTFPYLHIFISYIFISLHFLHW